MRNLPLFAIRRLFAILRAAYHQDFLFDLTQPVIRLGDYGYLRNGLFKKVGNLLEDMILLLGEDAIPEFIMSCEQSHLFASPPCLPEEEDGEVRLNGKWYVLMHTRVPEEEYGVFVQHRMVREEVLPLTQLLGDFVLQKWQEGQWEDEYCIAWNRVIVPHTKLAYTISPGGSIGVIAQPEGGFLDMGELELRLNFSACQNLMMNHWTTSFPTTPAASFVKFSILGQGYEADTIHLLDELGIVESEYFVPVLPTPSTSS